MPGVAGPETVSTKRLPEGTPVSARAQRGRQAMRYGSQRVLAEAAAERRAAAKAPDDPTERLGAVYELFMRRHPKAPQLQALSDEIGAMRGDDEGELATATGLWLDLVEGKQCKGVEAINLMIGDDLDGDESEALWACAHGLTHGAQVIPGVAYHPLRYVEPDPKFRSLVHLNFDSMDRNGDEVLSWAEFVAWWTSKAKQRPNTEAVCNARVIFHMHDQQGNGLLDKDEMAGLVRALKLEPLLLSEEALTAAGADIARLRSAVWKSRSRALATVGAKLMGVPIPVLEEMQRQEAKELKKRRRLKKSYTGSLPSELVEQGWLNKRGGQDGQKRFKKRFFVMGNHLLGYFEKEEWGRANCRGVIDLDSATVVARGTTFRSKGLFGFNIVTKERTYNLYASSDEERTCWELAISAHTPCLPRLTKTPNEQFGGTWLEVTFTDWSDPQPFNIQLGGGTSLKPLHIGHVDDTTGSLHELHNGILLTHILTSQDAALESQGPEETPLSEFDVSGISVGEAYDVMQSSSRPLTLRFYEPAEVEMLFESSAATRLSFSGVTSRQLIIRSIDPRSPCLDNRHMRPGLMLKSVQEHDISCLPVSEVHLMLESTVRPLKLNFIAFSSLESQDDNAEYAAADAELDDGSFDETLAKIRSLSSANPNNIATSCFDAAEFDAMAYADQVALLWCMNSGIENADSQMGCYACQPSDYDRFKPFFSRALSKYHGVPEGARHRNDWNLKHAEGVPEDGMLDLATLGLPPLSMRVRVGRNLETFPLPGAMTKLQRCELENFVLEKLLLKLISMPEFGGRYCSFTPGHPNHVDMEEYKALIDSHIAFKDMSTDEYLLSAGIAHHWPHGRGVYVSDDKTLVIWVGEEDHLRIMSMRLGSVLNEVFDTVKAALDLIEGMQGMNFAMSADFGAVTSCPTNLGTGMRSSVLLKLPNLTSDGTDTNAKAIAKPLGLTVRGIGGEHTPIGADGTVDISPSARFCITEAEIMVRLFRGIAGLLTEEAKGPPAQHKSAAKKPKSAEAVTASAWKPVSKSKSKQKKVADDKSAPKTERRSRVPCVGHLLVNGSSTPFRVATFGPALFEQQGEVLAVWAEPRNAATELRNAAALKDNWAICERGGDKHVSKALRAQAAGAVGLLIVNTADTGRPLVPRGEANGITIPVLCCSSIAFSTSASLFQIGVSYCRGASFVSVTGQLYAIKFSSSELEVKWLYRERYMQEAKQLYANYAATRLVNSLSRDVRRALIEDGGTLTTRQAFEKFDTDGDGVITAEEFTSGLSVLGMTICPDDIDRFMVRVQR